MREFHGKAAEVVAASIEDCLALVAAVDRYPDWCPDIVREVEVLGHRADGSPNRVRMTIRIERGPLKREFELFLGVVVEPPATVRLTRVSDDAADEEFNATWLLQPASGTRIELEVDAKLRVPAYVPVGGIADGVAEGFVTAAGRELSA